MSPRADPAREPTRPDIGVIALVADAWSNHWQPRHQVLTRLAHYFNVVWVSPAVSWRRRLPDLVGSSASRERGRHPAAGRAFHAVHSHQGWPAVKRPRWLSNAVFDLRAGSARATLRRKGCERIVLYLWSPDFARALESVPHDLSLYHIDDEYSWSETEHPLDPVERRVIECADRVIIHSPGLLEKKGGINPRTISVPNGVDYHVYATSAPEPPDLASIPHPRIGYAGVLKMQLDWQLLDALSAMHREWSFVFVGPMKQGQHGLTSAIGDIFSRPNVHWLGARPVHALHAYQQHFDVGTMPYRRTAYTRYIYPLKLHESLATGRPAVGTRIRTLEDFADVVALADTAAEWSAAIADALTPAANSAARREARQAVARRHDWGVLVDRIAAEILDGISPNVRENVSSGSSPA
jgi:glycosyltransferase involved in cell wall biosynthesis